MSAEEQQKQREMAEQMAREREEMRKKYKSLVSFNRFVFKDIPILKFFLQTLLEIM
jgi:hypothetical protein